MVQPAVQRPAAVHMLTFPESQQLLLTFPESRQPLLTGPESLEPPPSADSIAALAALSPRLQERLLPLGWATATVKGRP